MLIREFNRLVNDEIKKGTIIKEEVLFECLQESFGKLAYSDIVHGYKGQVEYTMPGTMITEKCEAADLIIFSFNEKQIRYTLLQNKTKHKETYYGVMPFKISVRQLILLSEKPIINVLGSSTYLYKKIFSSAILDSVGSISVFYKKTCLRTGNDYFDMNYMIANRLKHNSPVTILQFQKNTARVARFKGTINKVVSKASFDEVEALTNLVDFEYSIRNMLVGTPILFKTIDADEKDVLKFILSKILERKESEIYKNIEDSKEKDVYSNFRRIFEENSITITEEENERYRNIKVPTIILIDNSKQKEHSHFDYCHCSIL